MTTVTFLARTASAGAVVRGQNSPTHVSAEWLPDNKGQLLVISVPRYLIQICTASLVRKATAIKKKRTSERKLLIPVDREIDR